MRPTSAVEAAAAAPATTWSDTSPKRNRRPEKGRRLTSGVSSAEDTGSLAVDLLDRLLRDDEDRLRDRLEEQLRPVRLSLCHGPEQEFPQVCCLGRGGGNDHVGIGRDRIGVRELLRRVDDREFVRRRRRLLVA